MAIAHDLCQHFCPGHNRHTPAAGRRHFRVFTAYGSGDHHHIGPGAVLGPVTNLHLNSHRPEAFGNGTFLQVRTRHAVALVLQYLGNTAHAGTTNTNKVDAVDPAHFGHLVHQWRIVCISHWRPPDSNSRLSPLHRDGPSSVRPAPFRAVFRGHRPTLSGCRPVPRG